ncbi:MAG: polysaccharide deacetylase family protein [Calditrichaeota bacterium]|nr:polysaccharide deacetylase family protein [Calditrichota bacterium]
MSGIASKRLLAAVAGPFTRLCGGRIFNFHSVHPTHRLAHRPDIFRQAVGLLLASGREIATIAELGDRLRQHEDVGSCLAINFDDGYADNVEIALPILVEFGVKATFFIAAGCIQAEKCVPGGDHHFYDDLPMMSIAQLRELQQAGMEIGSHTFSHRYMRNDSPEIVEWELRASKQWLEDKLGTAVTSFAFPNGEVPHKSREVLIATGYHQAVTMQWNTIQHNTDPLFMPRQIMDHYDSLKDVRDKLNGKRDYMRFVQMISSYHRRKIAV